MKILKLAILGCGSRAKIYAEIAATMPQCYEIVAVADPSVERRKAIKVSGKCSAADEFVSAETFLGEPKSADVVIIATQDHQHREQATLAMERGYDLLLEKPIATSLEDVHAVESTATRLGRRVVVCHVLRYAPFYQRIKEIIASGRLGSVISIQATEGVGTFHQAHSFVRGHWAREEESSPMILAKACHDMDILFWLADSNCLKVSSFGGVSFFRQENAPVGAAENCMEDCPHAGSCSYDAHLYLSSERRWLQYIVPSLGTEEGSNEKTLNWLRNSAWSRCAFKCQNTATDHQVVSMQFVNGITATFTMTAFAKGRSLEIYGTKACLRGGEFFRDTFGCDLVITPHGGQGEEKVTVEYENVGYSGHGGGDFGLMRDLYTQLTARELLPNSQFIQDSTESHRMAFAAHASRQNGGIPCTVDRTVLPQDFRLPKASDQSSKQRSSI